MTRWLLLIRLMLVGSMSVLALAGCIEVDPRKMDLAACDEISLLLESAGASSLAGAEAPGSLVNGIKTEAMPKASAEFRSTLSKLVDSYEATSKGSIFSKVSGAFDSAALSIEVMAHCLDVSSKVNG
jgi:hypothetical protein